eukprot:PhM_4_TR3812/c0_g1_i1/m.91997
MSPEVKRLLSLADPDARGFKLHAEKDGTLLYTCPVDGYQINMTKGIVVMPCSALEFKEYLSHEKRCEWDDMFEQGTTLEQLNDEVSTRYLAFKSPSRLLNNRDFEVIVNEHTSIDGVVIVCARSVQIEKVRTPPRSGYTRGSITLGGYVAVPTSDCSCIVTYIALVDPKGWVPPPVVNLLQHRQLDSMLKLRNFIIVSKKSR